MVADGDVPAREHLDAAWPGWAAHDPLVVAADGGLEGARSLGLTADLLVGDLDSVDPATLAETEAAGLPVRRARSDKDESDTELALLEAVAAGAPRITVLGALGGERPDHALANVWLLAHPALGDREAFLLDAVARVSLISAPGPDGRPVRRSLRGPTGATISLLPFGGDVEEVTTTGLRYPLHGERLLVGPARGLSNVRVAGDAAVSVGRGRLLVVEIAPERTGLSSRS